MSEELRPCPFCGDMISKNYALWDDNGVGTCDCCGAKYMKRANQNAYCWKKIDELEAENKRMKKALNDISKYKEEKSK